MSSNIEHVINTLQEKNCNISPSISNRDNEMSES